MDTNETTPTRNATEDAEYTATLAAMRAAVAEHAARAEAARKAAEAGATAKAELGIAPDAQAGFYYETTTFNGPNGTRTPFVPEPRGTASRPLAIFAADKSKIARWKSAESHAAGDAPELQDDATFHAKVVSAIFAAVAPDAPAGAEGHPERIARLLTALRTGTFLVPVKSGRQAAESDPVKLADPVAGAGALMAAWESAESFLAPKAASVVPAGAGAPAAPDAPKARR